MHGGNSVLMYFVTILKSILKILCKCCNEIHKYKLAETLMIRFFSTQFKFKSNEMSKCLILHLEVGGQLPLALSCYVLDSFFNVAK